MTDTSGQPPVRRVQAGSVFGGTVVGVVLSWLVFAAALMTGTPPVDGGVPPAALLALTLAAVVGVALLAHPRSRQAGTGFLMGLAIGMITGAGVCGLTVTAG